MNQVFLDANVLFSAAYRLDTPLRKLFSLPNVMLVTSAYALEEAKAESCFWAAEGRVGAVVQICRSGIGVAATGREFHPGYAAGKRSSNSVGGNHGACEPFA